MLFRRRNKTHRFERGVCWECGHKETWREAWHTWRLLRKAPPPGPFPEWLSAELVKELRPTNAMRAFTRKGEGAVTFEWADIPKED